MLNGWSNNERWFLAGLMLAIVIILACGMFDDYAQQAEAYENEDRGKGWLFYGDVSNRWQAIIALVSAIFMGAFTYMLVIVSRKANETAKAAHDLSERVFLAQINAERGYLSMRQVTARFRMVNGTPVPIGAQTHFILENVGKTMLEIKFIHPMGGSIPQGANPITDTLVSQIKEVQWRDQMSMLIPPNDRLATRGSGADGPIAIPAPDWTASQLHEWGTGAEYVFAVVIGYKTFHGQRRRFASTAALRRGADVFEIPLGEGNPFDEPEPDAETQQA